MFISAVYFRFYQWVLRIASYFFSFEEPRLYLGEPHRHRVLEILKYHGHDAVLLVTDPGIAKLNLHQPLLDLLQEKGVRVVVYDQTQVNPTLDNIAAAKALFVEKKCKAVIGFGGGSAMDCAKGVTAMLARPKKRLSQLRGLLKVGRRTTLLIAIPTTAGTGSEATVAVVVTDPNTKEKYAISDPTLIPDYALLDPQLTVTLPPHLTAYTGLDALTHAIEAYINQGTTSKTKRYALEAIEKIHYFLPRAFQNGSDLRARKEMLHASYLAGVAFTRAYVGYVHCVAHTLGGFYETNHGLANAVVMPHVLKAYGPSVYRRLSIIADLLSLRPKKATSKEKALAVIDYLESLNRTLGIPSRLKGVIRESDIPLMASRAYDEGNPLYPVPRIFTKQEITRIYYAIKE